MAKMGFGYVLHFLFLIKVNFNNKKKCDADDAPAYC